MSEVLVSCHGHALVQNFNDNGWACDGRLLAGGCIQECTDFNQTAGWRRYRCNACDFDLCEGCVQKFSRTNSVTRMVRCHMHPLQINHEDNGWVCNGSFLEGGCIQGCTTINQSNGWLRFRCIPCDFDLCEGCVQKECAPSTFSRIPNVPPESFRVRCHRHPLTVSSEENWVCDGRRIGGCVRGCTDTSQTIGWTRYRCITCDFNLCDGCLHRELLPITTITSSVATVPSQPLQSPQPSVAAVIAESESESESEPEPEPEQILMEVNTDSEQNLQSMQLKIDRLALELQVLRGNMQSLDSLNLTKLEELRLVLQNSLDNVNARIVELKSSNREIAVCIVCEEKAKSILLLPCRHLCLCSNCANHPVMTKCPLCCQNVDCKLEVYA